MVINCDNSWPAHQIGLPLVDDIWVTIVIYTNMMSTILFVINMSVTVVFAGRFLAYNDIQMLIELLVADWPRLRESD